jgi:hypothetical protein
VYFPVDTAFKTEKQNRNDHYTNQKLQEMKATEQQEAQISQRRLPACLFPTCNPVNIYTKVRKRSWGSARLVRPVCAGLSNTPRSRGDHFPYLVSILSFILLAYPSLANVSFLLILVYTD